MSFTLLITPLLVLVFWIYAECRMRVWVRICAGIACIAMGVAAAVIIAGVTPHYERGFHRNALKLAGELLSTGEVARVEQAVGSYNSIAATDTTLRAAIEMWTVLNHGPKQEAMTTVSNQPVVPNALHGAQ